MPRIDLRLDPLILQSAAAETVVKGSAGYPPFDISWFPDEPEGIFLRITLAVAGFDESELELYVENNLLLVSGLQEERQSGEFLYRGIAGRQFKRQFQLADGMDVKRAYLERGLLNIDLSRTPKEVRKINISVSK